MSGRAQLVVIESPYAGNVKENEAYARAAMADALKRGEYPIASHLLYTQPGIFDDRKVGERRKGIEAGLAWGAHADFVAFYVDLGWSGGMRAALKHWEFECMRTEARKVLGWVPQSECTGLSARWCPVHGDCDCDVEEDFNDEDCPLHSQKSSHAETA